MAPAVRNRTLRDVKAATLSGGARTLDQSRLWTDVDAELAACGSFSPTSDYYVVVERQGRDARARAERLIPEPGQVGAIVLADGGLVGFEATGHHGLWSLLAKPTLASYLLGQHRGAVARGDRASATDWLARVQCADVKLAPGLGLGQDLDVRGAGLSGVGIALDGVPVHVAVFRA
jgi:hypothetical protein